MVAVDAPPKTKRKPNKVKFDEDHLFTKLDKQLEHELDTFREKIHAEMWGDVTDILFSSHIFLTTLQIIHLCHLAHISTPQTLEDLENNFQWNWMQDYGHELLGCIHRVYNVKPSTSIDGIGSSQIHSQPDTMMLDNQVSSEPLKGGKQRVKRGPGNQRCSACGMLGHNSKFHNRIRACQLTNLTIQGSNPCCSKKTIPNTSTPLSDNPMPLSNAPSPAPIPLTYAHGL